MATLLKKYKKGLAAVTAENEQLAKENKKLSDSSIPPDVAEQYTTTPRHGDITRT